MDILNPRSLRQRARQALARGREPKKVIYTYAGITLAISLLILVLNLWLEKQISGTGGLGNMGTRAVFSTVQQAIPMLTSFVAMCLDLGFLYGLMRISRGQYADHTDLKVGFQRFWPLLRMVILQGIVYFALAFLAIQISGTVFMFTSWSEPLMELIYPIAASGSTVIDEATMTAAIPLITPMFLIFGLVYAAVLIPVLFKLRMASFCLLDDPRAGALAAMRASSRMMRRRFLDMLKIDLSLWPYHLAVVLVNLLLYSDVLLSLMGIPLPMDGEVYYLVTCALSAVAQFGIQVLLRSPAETTYLLAYEQLREKRPEEGVVLGNIFDT